MKWVWFDNKIILSSKASVSCFEECVLYGQGLFETMRSYSGVAFALGKHIKRLTDSCPILGIKAPSEGNLAKAVRSVIKKNNIKDAYIRLNVLKASPGAHIFVFAKKLNLPSKSEYKRGYSLALFENEKIGDSVLNSVKSLNRNFYLRLLQQAHSEGFNEALFLNARGEVVEGSRTNIFLVKGNKVITPELSSGCLAGITRSIVIALLKKMKITIFEKTILPKELFSQDEVFVTNSLIEIMPVRRLNGKLIGKGLPGRLTKKIMTAYGAHRNKVLRVYLGRNAQAATINRAF